MFERPVPSPVRPDRTARPDRSAVVASAVILLVIVALLGGLLLVVARGRGPGAAVATASPTPAPGTFLLPVPREAPEIALTDASGNSVTLSSFRGREVLVFFGYTHCPDVCPVTIGTVGNVIATLGGDLHALFVSVDPERDTQAWLAEFTRFMPPGFTALTGTAAEIRRTADAWGIKYARVEAGSADGYSMAHTADVFLVDADGLIRASFPFGTEPGPMAATVREVGGATAALPSAAPSASPAATSPATSPATTQGPAQAGATLFPEVISSSVWSGGASPLILRLHDTAGPLDDTAVRATLRILDGAGAQVGPVVTARAIQPPGVARVTQLAYLDIPAPGTWRIEVTAFRGGERLEGAVDVTAHDPGATSPLGKRAPTTATPTLASAGNDVRLISTDPTPDRRLYERSTADFAATGTPYVLVADSIRFRVTPACGKAVALAKSLMDRWVDVGFVHLEPYPYALVTEEPVLQGDITDPPVTDVARAWGLGTAGWGGTSVPWVFVVDRDGIVRAKYQGLVGSDDVDVIVASLMAAP